MAVEVLLWATGSDPLTYGTLTHDTQVTSQFSENFGQAGRADMSCHWEDTDCAVQEMYSNVSGNQLWLRTCCTCGMGADEGLPGHDDLRVHRVRSARRLRNKNKTPDVFLDLDPHLPLPLLKLSQYLPTFLPPTDILAHAVLKYRHRTHHPPSKTYTLFL